MAKARRRATSTTPGLVGGALFGLGLAVAVAGLHLAVFGGDVSGFVRAGPPQVDPARLPSSLRIVPAAQAYDGEYFYRLTLDPLVVDPVGITLDGPSYRQQRLLYPLLARFASIGRVDWVPAALVAVNVVGLGLLGGLGAHFAQTAGRRRWWGVLIPLYPGFAYSLSRDLAEITEVTFLLAALVIINRRPPWAAAILLACAVAARETALIFCLGLLADDALNRLRRRPTSSRWIAGLAGVVVFVTVQVSLWLRWGTLPVLAGSGNLAFPFTGVATYLRVVGPLGWLEVVWVAWVGVGALLTMRLSPGPIEIAIGAYSLLLISLSSMVWAGDAAWLRAASELYVLCWLVLFRARAELRRPLAGVGVIVWPLVVRWAIVT
ncbi:MAG: hypothetical protein NVSMB2_01820 [Chloroflexota bacterium]